METWALNSAIDILGQEPPFFMMTTVDSLTLSDLQQDYAEFLEFLPDAVLIINQQGRIVMANSTTHLMFGYAQSELLAQPVEILIPASHRSGHESHVASYFSQPQRRPMGSMLSLVGSHCDGHEFPVDIMLGPFGGSPSSFVICIIRDITVFRRTQEQLQAALLREQLLARTDPLTGVANTRCFYDLLEQEMARTRRHGNTFTLACLDLDNFKKINDSHGHSIGDALLRRVAERSMQCLRKNDVFARMGGDEFALLLPETGETEASSAIVKLQRELLELMKENDWPVTFSIGVLTCMEVPATADELLRDADLLMYSVKRRGKNAINFEKYPRRFRALQGSMH